MNKEYILGIDTSNYKTSVAVIDNEHSVVCDLRRFLNVKQGEKGLRQSDALFQHVKNLPEMFEELKHHCDIKLSAVSYSSKPRPIEGSYMPVFLAGESFAKSIGALMDIPVYGFSHQEGHIEAVKAYSNISDIKHFMTCHFSGGTTEILQVSESNTGYEISIIGGSKDISFGQVIDRAGVLMGMGFPAGETMDSIACRPGDHSGVLTPIKAKDGWINLSGIDTQMKNKLQEDSNTAPLIKELFIRLADSMSAMIIQCASISGLDNILLAGGVSSSVFIKNILNNKLSNAGIQVHFDEKGMSQDNAVGTALLGGKALWL